MIAPSDANAAAAMTLVLATAVEIRAANR